MSDYCEKAICILNHIQTQSNLEKELAMLFLSSPSKYSNNSAMLNDISTIYNRVMKTQTIK